MTSPEHPFVDNGEGFPTPDSVQSTMQTLGIASLAEVPVTFRGEQGTMVDMITRCRIEHLTQDWPKSFIAQVIGSAKQAAQPTQER